MGKLLREWQDCDKIKIFEFRVIDKRDNSVDWLTFDIYIVGDFFIAQHGPLNQEQRDSKFISSIKTIIDPDFSLDENLSELYDACVDAIAQSDWYREVEECKYQ